MAGQHIEREARYEQTGLTSLQRDEMILALRRRGWSQRKISRYPGITQPAVHYALTTRLAGKPRVQARYEMCDVCGRNFPKDKLNQMASAKNAQTNC